MRGIGGITGRWFWFPLGVVLGMALCLLIPAVSGWLGGMPSWDTLWKLAVLLLLVRLNLKK